ncbi:phage tail tape measure protein [Lysinibacillus sp. Bpr_S20]|uniref:phage tail tape measure protein n=1 Tax=Lysinibacillus sp. Bpr_S20 TaxID=2933964 RepID=UPI002013B3EA|nr:phage tail tape measure protein [Lysinibacillus sp. Bpr_S20]MCL1700611.1 phage tail tape measure protein [Lysinibacillus sp. Bpr_S20]
MQLSAVFKVRDQGSAQLRKLTQMMDKMNQTSKMTSGCMSKAQLATTKLGGAASSASNRMGGFETRVSSLRVGANGLSASLRGMQSSLIGLMGAYAGVTGAAKFFNATIGAAANYEQNAMAISGMFGDDKQAKKYLQMVEKAAIDSPVLNSTDMMTNSKAFVGLSKNVDELKQVWGLVERIQAFSGVDTQQASFSTKELMQGDYVSMYEAIGLDKKELQKITKMDGLSAKMAGLDKLLTKMGVTDEMVNKMGNTTKGLWSQLQEKSQTFFKNMGMESNTKLGDFLRRLNTMFEGIDTEALSNKLGSMLGKATDKAIALYDAFMKWREPITYALGGIAAFVGALAIVGIISALANPISLIAMGIAAAAVGFKALYDNSETFRGAIDGIVSKVKSLFSAFKSGGTSGLINALFPPGIANKVNSIVDGIKTKVSELMSAFKEGGFGGVFNKLFGDGSFESLKTKFEEVKSYISEKIAQFMPVFERLKSAFSQAWSTVSDIISNAWSIIEPYLSGFWNMLQILGDVAMMVFNNVIAPAISFLVQLFSTLAVAQPILTVLALGFEALSTIMKWMWDNVLAPLVDFILTAVKNAFDNFAGALSTVQGWFETLSGWISTAYGHVKDFIGFIGKAKMPSWITNGISAGVNFVGNLIGVGDGKGGNAKSNYHGLDYVPYDSYYTRLHKGERVMTAQENKDYSQGKGGNGSGGFTFNYNGTMVIREEADIQKVAMALSRELGREASRRGY